MFRNRIQWDSIIKITVLILWGLSITSFPLIQVKTISIKNCHLKVQYLLLLKIKTHCLHLQNKKNLNKIKDFISLKLKITKIRGIIFNGKNRLIVGLIKDRKNIRISLMIFHRLRIHLNRVEKSMKLSKRRMNFVH